MPKQQQKQYGCIHQLMGYERGGPETVQTFDNICTQWQILESDEITGPYA